MGSAGAGTGATVAKALGVERARKGGAGSALEATGDGLVVGALVAVNCFGEGADPDSGRVVAGPRGEDGRFADSLEALRSRPALAPFGVEPNSTIGVVATNAALTKSDCYRLAVMAQAGLARTIRPVYTPVDGDTIFALATGAAAAGPLDVLRLGALAARAVERAVLRAVTEATGLAGVPSAAEWTGGR